MPVQLSIIIPVYNSASTISKVIEAVKKDLAVYSPEIIIVNDGSKDNSEIVCEQLAQNDTHIKFISLKKNFGEHNAVMCGLNHATGEYVAIIDDDLQNPPAEISKLLEEAKKGYDVIYSKYQHKQHGFLRNIASNINSRIATWLLEKPKGDRKSTRLNSSH